MSFEGEVSKQVNKLGSFTSICRQLRPNGPSQFQQQLLLRFTGVPTDTFSDRLKEAFSLGTVLSFCLYAFQWFNSMHKSKYFIVPINVKCQAVGLPADSRWVGLQKEATQELNEGFLVCKLVKLTNQRHAQLILLASNTVTCSEQKRYNTGSQPPWMLNNFWYPA